MLQFQPQMYPAAEFETMIYVSRQARHIYWLLPSQSGTKVNIFAKNGNTPGIIIFTAMYLIQTLFRPSKHFIDHGASVRGACSLWDNLQVLPRIIAVVEMPVNSGLLPNLIGIYVSQSGEGS
ncbi:hypothetical protein CLAFUW4_06101 [Fulvia fulva]|uniref:Uncharacterized protein n=1 Tax=Passalora fulva TaxID=5499 RepID=A0A9Q8P9A7_PASFU|nr:uncharacterized protein CLAFUR5_06245 [Fulvia fulva]KAK4624698.1 hypothetical protein CLAFUR4_06105 [Fulvia fulva]KAK4625124.1 hypothetical protein CLAFUR0_06109 [Fulvia fulva]UJO18090.1 hypothetical protein CLAFUR5_06245 [Fulvia fulva]WPV15415.1 hypothetical protein CLAFUW4_06101 [Fulvia fulva]WPV30088.1 hypothetical protein CLAFUW7_06098 [Fulvia fulva]